MLITNVDEDDDTCDAYDDDTRDVHIGTAYDDVNVIVADDVVV